MKSKKVVGGIAAAALAATVGTFVYTNRDAMPLMPPLPPGYTGSGSSNVTWTVMPKAFAVVPGQGLAFTSISSYGPQVTLTWNTNTPVTVWGSEYPSGPWSAITNRTGISATVATYESNRFYRLSQTSMRLDRQWTGGFVTCVFGNNEIVFAMQQFQDWSPPYLLTITNGVLTGFPLAGIPPCAPFAGVADVTARRLYTLESGCYYGGTTGPYTVREWMMWGFNGFFTNAAQLASHTAGEFGNTWGDLIRLQSGALVWCWKNDAGYCWQYRSPKGNWHQPICINDIPMAPSIMVLGQHPDGTVFTAIARDSYHNLAIIALREQSGVLQWSSTRYIDCEGEYPEPSLVPDYANNRLIINRQTDPYFGWKWGEAWLTIKGSCMQSAFFYSENSVLESNLLPETNPPDIPLESYMINMSEPVAPHSATLADGKLWLIRQEINPDNLNFNLVCAVPWDDYIGWETGSKVFLYHAAPCATCRGLSRNWLRSYRNSDPNPTRLVFSNDDERGESTIFELR